jgi:cytochrome c peroxidase
MTICLRIAVLCVLLASCSRTPQPTSINGSGAEPPSATAQAFYADHFERRPTAAELTELGRLLFSDRTLSASGTMSCARCHDPAHAYGPPNDQSVQLGGPDLSRSGQRAVPSLKYLQNVPAFTEHHFDDSVDESEDQGPTGGHTWDGRADTIHDQARLPLLSPFEMANADTRAVVARLRLSPYAQQIRDTFGNNTLDDAELAFGAALLALEVFQQSPADFYPFDSKYDAWLRGTAHLTQRERHGLALFNDESKGNCASCHPSQVRQGAFPVFTDFGHIALAVPRNRTVMANASPDWRDLGLCGPLRTDFTQHPEYCGLFRVPSLRNVALRNVFFHNGVFHDLTQVVAFYAERDSNPTKWYGRNPSGAPRRYADLPREYWKNVNVDPPFGRKPDAKPALTSADIRDIVAFLGTLTDGYGAGAKP